MGEMKVHPMSIKFTVTSPHPLMLAAAAKKFLDDLLAGPLDDMMVRVELEPTGPAEITEVTRADNGGVVSWVWGREYVAKWREPSRNGLSGVHVERTSTQ